MIVPQIGDTFEEDLRGLIKMSRQYVCDTMDEVRSCGTNDFPAYVKITLRRSGPYKNSPKHLVTVYAEGMDEGGGGNSGIEPREDMTNYEFDIMLEENPIETYPKVEELIARFNGKRAEDGSGRVTFPFPFIGKGEQKGGAFGSGSLTPTGTKNPMYGLTSYLTLGSIFRQSYVTKKVSSAIFNNVGTVKKSLPYGLPTPEGFSWVVLPPRISRRGSCMSVDEEMRMIRDDSGIKIIYEMMRTAS